MSDTEWVLVEPGVWALWRGATMIARLFQGPVRGWALVEGGNIRRFESREEAMNEFARTRGDA